MLPSNCFLKFKFLDSFQSTAGQPQNSGWEKNAPLAGAERNALQAFICSRNAHGLMAGKGKKENWDVGMRQRGKIKSAGFFSNKNTIWRISLDSVNSAFVFFKDCL